MQKIQVTKVYSIIEKARALGRDVVSLQGSARSSKTYNTLIWLVAYLTNHAKTRASIVRKTLPALRGSVLVDFREILQRLDLWDTAAWRASELIYYFANGSWVEFFSTDDEQKLRGRKRDILFVNEASELEYIEWQQLQMRTTTFSILDYNPSFSDDHWIVALNREPSVYFKKTTYRDNPFLEPRIVAELERLKDTAPALWQVYGLGELAQVEGQVFPNVEVVDAIPDWADRRYIGVDFGYTNDPTAIVDVYHGLDADGAEHLFMDELHYRTQMSTADICNALKPYRGVKIDCESADPRLVDAIKDAGLLVYPVKKGADSVMAGIARMQAMHLHVTRRSVNVIRETRNYVYTRNRGGAYTNVPVDLFNHALDAVRYVVLCEFMKRKGNLEISFV